MSAQSIRLDRMAQLLEAVRSKRLSGLADLDALREIEQEAVNCQILLVDALRDAGHTWEHIGNALGVSKQAAWKRYGGPVFDVLAAVEGAEAGALAAHNAGTCSG